MPWTGWSILILSRKLIFTWECLVHVVVWFVLMPRKLYSIGRQLSLSGGDFLYDETPEWRQYNV